MADPVEGVVEEFRPPVVVQVSAEDIAALIADDAQVAKAAKIRAIEVEIETNAQRRMALVASIATGLRDEWLAVWKDRMDDFVEAVYRLHGRPPQPWTTWFDEVLRSTQSPGVLGGSWYTLEEIVFFRGSCGARWDMRKKDSRREYHRKTLPPCAQQWMPNVYPLLRVEGEVNRVASGVGSVTWGKSYMHDLELGHMDFPIPRPAWLDTKLMALWDLIWEQVDLENERSRLKDLNIDTLVANARIEITRAAVESSPEASAVRANVLASLDAVIAPRLGVKP